MKYIQVHVKISLYMTMSIYISMCMSECMNKYHIANQKVCVVVLFKLFVYKHICTNTYAYICICT